MQVHWLILIKDDNQNIKYNTFHGGEDYPVIIASSKATASLDAICPDSIH
jgi:hypothetical protein